MRKTEVRPIEPGQVWEVGGSRLQVAHVGKTLVHYRRYKTAARGVPTSLTAIAELQKYLRENKATLVQE